MPHTPPPSTPLSNIQVPKSDWLTPLLLPVFLLNFIFRYGNNAFVHIGQWDKERKGMNVILKWTWFGILVYKNAALQVSAYMDLYKIETTDHLRQSPKSCSKSLKLLVYSSVLNMRNW